MNTLRNVLCDIRSFLERILSLTKEEKKKTQTLFRSEEYGLLYVFYIINQSTIIQAD